MVLGQHDEQSSAQIAEESIARDLAAIESPVYVDQNVEAANSQAGASRYSLTGHYRRPSINAQGPRPFLLRQQSDVVQPLDQDREAAINEERDLLEDNHLVKKRSRRESGVSTRSGLRITRKQSVAGFLSRQNNLSRDEESAIDETSQQEPSETTSLLGHEEPEPPSPDDEDVDRKWEETVRKGEIQTTWQREAKTIGKYAAPLMLTFFLQNSLTLTSVFTVGHIDKVALGAVSIGSMTASITGYSVYFGLATALDTLCAQAYGSGNKKLVGLQLQRMVLLLWLATVPIAIVWIAGGRILAVIIPEKDVAELAGQYLKVLILGAPAYSCFESSKRYVQAQGMFNAAMYVLLICAPLNVFLHWLFVWHLGWGFIGCPIAVVITENVMPWLLFIYVRSTSAMECWPGFSYDALRNWGPMIRLALPGLAMMLAEFLAFEILTFSASWFDATALAAQAILQNLSIQTYTLPFPVSMAASTRIANLIGATLPEAAKVTAKVTFVIGAIVGLFNMIMLSSLRFHVPKLFTNDKEVIDLAAAVLPMNAAFQLFDALAAQANGVLRGLGRQEFGGYVCMIAYYLIAIPIALGTAFGLGLRLYGLWLGPLTGLGTVTVIEGVYIWRMNWKLASDEAAKRNAAG